MDKDTANFVQRCWDKDPDSRPKIEECVKFFRAKVDATRPLEEEANFIRRQVNDETILVLGGGGSGNNGDEILVLKENQWIKLSLRLPKCFKWGGAVYLNGEIYIFGGHKMEKELYKLESIEKREIGEKLELDKKTLKWIQLADMNEGRYNISNSCLEWKGSIWVFGGWDGGGIWRMEWMEWKNLKSVERYDPKENKWIKMPDMKYPRHDAAAAVHNGKFIVCGGYDDLNELKSVECFDPESGVWTELNDLPSPRHQPSLVSYNNSLILMGGADRKRYLNSVLELNNLEKGGTWTELPPMKSSRCDFSSAHLDNEIFVIGGKYRKGVEIFDGQNWRDGPVLPYVCGFTTSIIIPQYLATALCNYSE